MASTTHPPSGGSNPDPVSSLYLSDTFYTWFNVSNDLINKVNPIELYTITADTRDYLSINQADGITLENLGFGNWRIGYSLPANITGGHTFHQDINFGAGVSGHVVNTVNGLTGDRIAIQTISGKTGTFSGGTGNIPGAIFEINGVTGTTYGVLTLDVGPGTGPAGTILTPSGAPGTFDNKVFFFDSIAKEDQVGLRVRGTTVDGRAVIGGTTVDPYYALRINAINTNSLNSATAGGIRLDSNSSTAVDIKMSNQGVLAAGTTMYFISGHDTANSGINFMQGGGGGGTIGDATSVFQTDGTGIVLNGTVKDKNGSLPSNGDLLIADSSGKLVYGGLVNNFVKNINSTLFAGAGTTNFWLGGSSISNSSQLVPASWKGRTVVFHINIDSIHSANTGSSEGIYVSSQNSTSAVSASSANLVFSSSTLMSGGAAQEAFFHTLTFLIDVGTGANETVQIVWDRSGCDGGRASNLRSYGWHLL